MTKRTRRSKIGHEVDQILAQKPGKAEPTCPCVEAGECNCHRMHFTERCECPSCKEGARHATIARSRPWQGTLANERKINSVRNSLVGIYLDGVAGISPVIGEYAWKQIQPDKADVYLQKGQQVLDELVSQKAPPSAKSWLKHKVHELRNLIEKAHAVRDGAARQKMTADDYAELRRSLTRRNFP